MIEPVSDALTRSVSPSSQREHADDQFCGVAERRIQQAPDAVAEVLRRAPRSRDR